MGWCSRAFWTSSSAVSFVPLPRAAGVRTSAVAQRIVSCGVLLAALLSTHSLVWRAGGFRDRFRSGRLNDPMTKVAAHFGRRRIRRVVFVPFPHRSLGSGEDARCRWATKYTNANAASPNAEGLDPIQLAAYTEGVCIPDGLNSTLHVFSTAEAIECLNSTAQGRNISVTVSGDSYTRQLFIGLADILLGNPSNKQITNQEQRTKLQTESNERLAALHGNDSSFPDVQYPMDCLRECYGTDAPFSVRCSRCINNFTQLSQDAVGVVGAGAHNLRYFGARARERAKREGLDVLSPEVKARCTSASLNETIKDLERFFDLANRTIYVSMPSYQVEKVPIPYKNATHHTHAGRLYEGLLPSLAPRDRNHPFLDCFQLTRACHMNNCSYDGGHRSRYVNRWKAQLLLNTLCEVQDG